MYTRYKYNGSYNQENFKVVLDYMLRKFTNVVIRQMCFLERSFYDANDD